MSTIPTSAAHPSSTTSTFSTLTPSTLTLSLCMITKNEEQFLEQCLNSVKELVDEIIIVDTGSTDKTKEIASKFTDKIYDFQWCDDFSAARNESLKYATQDWILVLDADEVISKEDYQKIKELIQPEIQPEASAYTLIQRNYFQSEDNFGKSTNLNTRLNIKAAGQDEQGFILSKEDIYPESQNTLGWLPAPIIRLFRNSKTSPAYFSGVVHEDVSSSISGQIINSSIPIHHFGKLNSITWKKKWELYEKLAEKKVQQEKDYYAYFELGRQYLASKKIPLAKEMFLKSLSLNSQYWLNWFNLGSIALIEKELDLAIKHLTQAKTLNPQAGAIYSNLGVAYIQKKNYQKAIENFTQAVKLNPQDASAYKNLGLCLDSTGNKTQAYLAFKKAIELNPEFAKQIQLR